MNLALDFNFFYNAAAILGLLVLLNSIYQRYFMAFVLYKIMKLIHYDIETLKENLFTKVNEKVYSNVKDQKPKVLEIGIGAGENFRHFPKNSEVLILDKTDEFLPYLKESFSVRSDLEISKLYVEKAENMKSIESNSVDLVVHTFILCSVDDFQKVLNEIYRIMKPGGVCLFIEHSLADEFTFTRLMQKLIAKLWFICLDCRFKKMKLILNSSKYDTMSIEKYSFKNKLLFLVNPVYYGYGMKKISS